MCLYWTEVQFMFHHLELSYMASLDTKEDWESRKIQFCVHKVEKINFGEDLAILAKVPLSPANVSFLNEAVCMCVCVCVCVCFCVRA